ncbi:Protein of unknown function [Fibrobacter sp. UWB15]|jgi:hypothetical protein|nr:Protein of unknown function (DUF2914) [Fibrobacter sp. UWB6]SHF81815.1 Protein of unknown function [Fibrobacter sp. UWB8]SMG16203.1 Protein of unknown function [Fibrobacter sp. UWB15]
MGMQFVEKLREKPAVQKLEKFFPAIAFLGGFAWDSITLGQMVYGSDILILLAYYTGALILVILLSAQLEHPEGWTTERLQALAKAQAKPKPAAVAPKATKVAPSPAEEKSESAEPVSEDSVSENPDVKIEESRFRRAAAFIAEKTPARAKEAANRAALEAKEATAKAAALASAKAKEAASRAAIEAKDAAVKAKGAATKFAKNVGYESTAIPENAIVVRHRFLDREWSETWKQRFTWAVQFFFGGLFSALVVCYFKSSGSLASFLLVILLAILLVGNEFLQKKYESFGVSLAFFCLLGTMFMNFAIPHLVHRIGFIWFLISTVLSFGLCLFIWKISHRKKSILVAPALISIFLIVAYIMNWVPPVPLVLKQKIACQNFDKASYSCDVDDPSLLQMIGLKIPSVHRVDSSEVYFLTSVYAPAKLKAELEYLWYYQDPKTGKYMLTDRISSGRMMINGGRESGFRTFTRKKNTPPGKYRVEIAYKNGAVIGSGTFEVFGEPPEDGFVRDTLR